MSRIGKLPVKLPSGVDVKVADGRVHVKGPKGTLVEALAPHCSIEVAAGELRVLRDSDLKRAKAMHGLMRALVANMVTGVTKGWEKKLALVGVGYRAQAQGDKLNLSLGFSHPVVQQMPKGVKVATPTQTEIVVSGIDKQMVGRIAAEIRDVKSPEPYKGKGVRYTGEAIVLKETKKK